MEAAKFYNCSKVVPTNPLHMPAIQFDFLYLGEIFVRKSDGR
jgi:hypothetical protein